MKILLTGATGGIGKEIAFMLAEKGHEIILGCRSIAKGNTLADKIETTHGIRPQIVMIDLSDSTSVCKAVQNPAITQLDAVIHNAGVMNGRYTVGPDRREDTLNVNYHNTRLLTELLLDNIGDNGSIVFTTSATRSWYPFQKLKGDIAKREFGRLKTYALSKKLITRYAASLASEKKVTGRGIRVNCADPGVADTPMLRMNRWFDPLTDLFFRPFCLNPAKSAKTSVRALESDLTGYIFKSPFGKCPNRKKLKDDIV